jgi:hypothetical protein
MVTQFPFMIVSGNECMFMSPLRSFFADFEDLLIEILAFNRSPETATGSACESTIYGEGR